MLRADLEAQRHRESLKEEIDLMPNQPGYNLSREKMNPGNGLNLCGLEKPGCKASRLKIHALFGWKGLFLWKEQSV